MKIHCPLIRTLTGLASQSSRGTRVLLLFFAVTLGGGAMVHAETSASCEPIPSILGIEPGMTLSELESRLEKEHPYIDYELDKSRRTLLMGSALGATTQFYLDLDGRIYKMNHILFSLRDESKEIQEYLENLYGKPASIDGRKATWLLCEGRYRIETLFGVEITDISLQNAFHSKMADKIIGVE